IELPSGGIIDINYEADDYAYVQDKRAAEMFKVVNFAVDPANPSAPATLDTVTISPKNLSASIGLPNNYGGTDFYLYFKLKKTIPVSTSNIATKLYADYLGNKSKEIYFRFLSDITRYGDYEYISGYFDTDNSTDNGIGIVTTNTASNGDYQFAWIRLKKVPIGDRDNSITQQVNPICKANWQFGRLQVPRKVWEQPDPQSSGIEQTVRAIANSGMAQNIMAFFKGPNRTIRDKGFGRSAMMNKSWIRLQNPDGFKYGGGIRVKSVVISDKWKSMVNPTNDATINSKLPSNYEAQYGQEYTYTTFDAVNNCYISSGVASWEPQPGGDENPFHEPVFFNEEKKLVPDDESYIEKPYGESFFPSPGVGYSKVTVKNYIPTTGSPVVTRHGTGKTVQEFYTARDFPTITRVGWLGTQHWKTNPIFSLLRIKMKDYMTATQGFVVELNDMHGKPKTVSVYAEGQTEPLSEVKYFYKTQAANDHQLDNNVYVLKKDGSVGLGIAGMDYDFIADMREQETKVVSAGANINVASFLVAIIPGIVPTIIPSWSSEDTRFRSASTTKVINRYGILVRTEARDAGSTATTENLAWDAETGELLLTKTYTDFDDAVFNFNYPAHWSYDRMGQAYKNVGAYFSSVAISAGTAIINNANQYFVKGDEVSVEAGSYSVRAWVCSTTSTDISLIDVAGLAVPSGLYNIKILRSGRRNMQSLSVGSVTTRQNPLKDNVGGDGIYDAFNFTNVDVLNANAAEYAELWSVAKGKTTTMQCNCAIGDVGAQLAGMLSSLASSGDLLTYTTILTAGVYSHGYTPDLNAAFSSPNNMNWGGSSGSSSALSATFNWSGAIYCTLSMDLPAGYTWSQVTGLNNFIPVSDTCSSTTNNFSATATVNIGGAGPPQYIQLPITGNSTCFNFGGCSNTTTCGVQSGNVVNPYFHNILGNWRMLRSELYLSDRLQTTATNDNLDIRKDGIYTTFTPFWMPNSGNDWLTSPTNWTWAQEVTKYTPFGNEVENKDALGRYSSAVFGYNNTLPLAVASNTRQQDVGFDGFEDYAFNPADCRELHFSFFDSGTSPDATQAHTGLYSMKVTPNTTVDMTRQLAPTLASRGALTCPYTVSAGDLNGAFAPYTGGGARTYVLNYWVKETTTLGTPVFNYNYAKIDIYVNSIAVPLTLVQKSEIIEGWQQYQYTFTLASSASGPIDIKLHNTNLTTINTWFDDVRILPFEASMTSYVYHPINQRLTAQLDENNYATFYEYDEEGALVRVKKETERGIVTIKEARNNSYHK
ncbi:MAG: hypothetical protein M3R17_13800, partial [Bacteroidota bacterium]|nr:hypothetical protein [Bacteroidota bacterium]